MHVYIEFTIPATPAPPAALVVATLPLGFRPSTVEYGPNSYSFGAVVYSSDGTVNIYSRPAGTDRIHATWTTKDAWPATLPGVTV